MDFQGKIHEKKRSRDTEVDVLERFHRNLSRVTLRGDGTQVDDADEVVKEMGGGHLGEASQVS